jgi:hypothetical protein
MLLRPLVPLLCSHSFCLLVMPVELPHFALPFHLLEFVQARGKTKTTLSLSSCRCCVLPQQRELVALTANALSAKERKGCVFRSPASKLFDEAFSLLHLTHLSLAHSPTVP